jgi:hypothetical protein
MWRNHPQAWDEYLAKGLAAFAVLERSGERFAALLAPSLTEAWLAIRDKSAGPYGLAWALAVGSDYASR